MGDAFLINHPSTTVNEGNLHLVAQAFAETPKQSARQIAQDFSMADHSFHCMLKKMNFCCYRLRLLHALHEIDSDRRIKFCEWYSNCEGDNPAFDRTILWSDEATFKLNGHINWHNAVYWASENPFATISDEINVPGICV